jgi:hypothetical protein
MDLNRLDCLHGFRNKEKPTNDMNGLEGGRIELQSGIYQKNNQ